MAKQKTTPNKDSVEAFLDQVAPERKQKEAYHILDMMKHITGEEAVMWGSSIIGFGKYHYKYDSGHEGDAALLGFSPRKQNLVLYVLTKFKGEDELLNKLGKFKTGKVCLYVNKLADIDMDVLRELITKSWDHVERKLK